MRGAGLIERRDWLLVQIAWPLCDKEGQVVRRECLPQASAARVRGITVSDIPLRAALEAFRQAAAESGTVVAHTMAFDGGVVAVRCAKFPGWPEAPHGIQAHMISQGAWPAPW